MQLVFTDVEMWDYIDNEIDLCLPEVSGDYFVGVISDLGQARVELGFYDCLEKIWTVNGRQFNALITREDSKNIEHIISWSSKEIVE